MSSLAIALSFYGVFALGGALGFLACALMSAGKKADEQADRDFTVGFRDKL